MKVKLYRGMVEPHFTYCGGAMALKKTEMEKLDALHRKQLRSQVCAGSVLPCALVQHRSLQSSGHYPSLCKVCGGETVTHGTCTKRSRRQ